MKPIGQTSPFSFFRDPGMGASAAKSLSTFPLAVRVSGKRIVEGPHDFIHALHISDARVELGIDEQDPLHHLPVGFAAIGQNLILVQG